MTPLLSTDEAMSPFLHFIHNEVRHPLPLSIRGTGAEEQAFNTRAYRMHPALVSIVNIIRNQPDEFPLWHSSSIAELYKPAIFENKKKDTGYWF